MNSFDVLQHELDDLEARGLRRFCRSVEAVERGRLRIEGRWRVHLGSNDYLGLSRHPRVVAAAQEATARFGSGAGSARLIGGTLRLHEELEAALARFKQAPACLVFSTGYMAALGAVTALVGPEDLVVADHLSHASLIDACRLSRAAFRVYPHLDADRLAKILRERRNRYRRALIVTEGVFSMDGDQPPLADLVEAARRYDAWLLVDDAHGTGVFGAQGRGSLEYQGIAPEGILQMGTLSKALGSLGGYVAGPSAAVEILRNRARSFLYTTAPPAACAAAALQALQVIQEEPARPASEPVRRERLWANVRLWRDGLARAGCEVIPSVGPIVPIRVGAAAKALAQAQALLEAGVYAPAIRPPTVPAGSSRIRTSITASHTAEDLESALTAFQQVHYACR